jgi:predicted dithiol-disulfide oxidoreductase (DUF899 family)
MTEAKPKVGTRADWLAARVALLEREKELTRRSDELARERRALPWVPIEDSYTFETEAGRRTLAELFEGRSQLLVFHLMFGPDDELACEGCSFTADNWAGAGPHLNYHGVSFVAVSRAPLEKLLPYGSPASAPTSTSISPSSPSRSGARAPGSTSARVGRGSTSARSSSTG